MMSTNKHFGIYYNITVYREDKSKIINKTKRTFIHCCFIITSYTYTYKYKYNILNLLYVQKMFKTW